MEIAWLEGDEVAGFVPFTAGRIVGAEAHRLADAQLQAGGLRADLVFWLGPARQDTQQRWRAIMLAALDLEVRAVVVLRYYLDWPTARVADALGIPEGTVKSRILSGLKRLRSEFVATGAPSGEWT